VSQKLTNELRASQEQVNRLQCTVEALREDLERLREEVQDNYARKRGPKAAQNGNEYTPAD
jgi:phage shock protein A